MNSVLTIRIFALVAGVSSLGVCQPSDGKAAASRELNRGVIVESVVKGTQADKLGIRSGDTLLRWKRGAVHGQIRSPFDLAYISIEHASQGPVTVNGTSRMVARTRVFGSDTWGIQTRPNFVGEFLAAYQEAMKLTAGGKTVEAAERMRSAAFLHTETPWLASWFLSRAARLLFHAQNWQLSDQMFKQAIDHAENAGTTVRAELFRQWASSFEYRGELAQASRYYQENLLASEKPGPETMQVANSLLLLAAVDLEQDETKQAEAHLTRALTIAGRLAPASFQIISIYEDLGIVFESRGDLGKAEEYYLRALQIEEHHFRDSRQLASTLTNLGTLAHQRGDLDRSEAYHRRALAIAEQVEENGPQIADILSNLGDCVLEHGSLLKAETYQRRALALREQTSPGTVGIALTLGSLGKIARARKEFSTAEEYYKRAMEAAAKVETPDQELARLFTGEADLLQDKGDYQKSADFYRQALAIVEKANPGSIDHAEILANLAGSFLRQGQLESAAALYPEALATLESRASRLGGGEEDRARYRAWYVVYYQGYMDVLLRLGRTEQAFELLEGARARTLLEMLSHSHINLLRGADVATLRRQRSLRQELATKTEVRLRLITSEHQAEQVSSLDREIEELLMQEKDTSAQLRSRSPEYASLAEPKQLSINEIQDLLDEHTLLLEYSLGEDHSELWAATKDSLLVFNLSQKKEIENAARKVYELLSSGKMKGPSPTSRDWAKEKEYQQAAEHLSHMVLGPVAQILGTKRLLIVSDGALQYVPFSALPIPGEGSDAPPLMVEHEIVNLPSASVLAEIRRQRIGRSKLPGAVAVLADPVFEATDARVGGIDPRRLKPETNTGDLTRAANDLGLAKNGKVYLNRLVYTRKEAHAVMAVIPPGNRLQALDFDASRSAVMSGVLGQFRIVHFATHGLLNNKHPELSGLVLSLVNREGERQDGFLKLQDIYDLKLPADLIVLSGCETGLGEEISGEGLIGLTRGFMYAGASRVVASLWSVSDIATAELMGKFYKSMEKDGMSPAAALRAAQIQMWTHPEWKSAYYWAAFQIHGEWR
jgi:CHAT domain-containing protein/Tfp pilus assembly protein PilF